MKYEIVKNRNDTMKSSYKDGKIGRDVYVLQDTPNLISGITVVLPHSQTKGHIHPDREEHYYVISGSGYIQLDEKKYEIKEGDGIYVPPVSLHIVVNNTDEPMEFFWTAFPDEPKLLRNDLEKGAQNEDK